jgi:hypothetical protein
MSAEVQKDYSILDAFVSEQYTVPLPELDGELFFLYEKIPLLADGVTFFRLKAEDEKGLKRSHRVSRETGGIYIEMAEVVSDEDDPSAEEIESWVPDEVMMEDMNYWMENDRGYKDQERIDMSIEQVEEIFDEPAFMSRTLYGLHTTRDDMGPLYKRPVYMSGIRETEDGRKHELQGRPYGNAREIEDRLEELLNFSGANVPEIRQSVRDISDGTRDIME